MGTLGRELINNFEFVDWWFNQQNKLPKKKRFWATKEDFNHQTAQQYLRNFLTDEQLLHEVNLFKNRRKLKSKRIGDGIYYQGK